MDAQNHLIWCKRRALAISSNGNLPNAYASFVSDMRKHEDTKNHIGLEMGLRLLVSGNLNTTEKMNEFIKGFN